MARPNAEPFVPGVPDKEVTAEIKTVCPGFSDPLMAQIKRPDYYGVEPTDKVRNHIAAAFKCDAARKRRQRSGDGHRFTRRAGCRLSDETAELLEECISNDPKYQYMSELVHALLMGYIKRRQRTKAKKAA